MTRSLRRLHRVVFGGAVIVLPVLYVLGLAARPRMPAVVERLQAGPPAPTDLAIVHTVEPDPGGLPLRIVWLAGTRRGEATPIGLTIEALGDPALPDLLVYWTREPVQDRLPSDARLLGAFGSEVSRSWLWSDAAEVIDGSAVLYSLATQRIVAVWPLPPELAR